MNNTSNNIILNFTKRTRGKCNKNVILNFTKRTKNFVILNLIQNLQNFCVSLYAKERSSQKIQNLFYRFRLGGRNDRGSNVTLNLIQGLYRFRLRGRNDRGKCTRKELIKKPSPAFVVFAGAQTQLLPFLDLLQARRVSPTERCSCRLNLLAIRTCFAPSVRKSALTKREGIKNHFLTSLPTNLLTSKAAFTLAETLITLGIIGIVAAMTIPGLITKIQDQHFRVAYKKTYSSLNQAMKFMENEDVGIDLSGTYRNEKDVGVHRVIVYIKVGYTNNQFIL